MLNKGEALAEEVIKAKSFQVVDDEGNVRAVTTAMDSEAVVTSLFDSDGTPRISLSVTPDNDPSFNIFDADRTTRVMITSHIDGQTVRLNDEDGNPRAAMTLSSERDSAPAVTFWDKDGEVRVQLQLQESGESMLVYRDAQGNEIRAF